MPVPSYLSTHCNPPRLRATSLGLLVVIVSKFVPHLLLCFAKPLPAVDQSRYLRAEAKPCLLSFRYGFRPFGYLLPQSRHLSIGLFHLLVSLEDLHRKRRYLAVFLGTFLAILQRLQLVLHLLYMAFGFSTIVAEALYI